MPTHGEHALATLRGEHANTLTESEALHASEWDAIRESATAVAVPRVRHPFQDASQVELRRLGVTAPDRTVSEFTVKVRYQADPAMAPHDVVRAQSHVLDAVDLYYNHQHRLQDGSQLHVRMEFEEAPASAASDVVQLRQGDGARPGERPDMLTWYADMDPVAVAHEVGHHLDLHDEYVDPRRAGAGTLTAPGVTRDPSVMGSGRRFWADHTPVVDHNGHTVPGTAGLRDRHLDELYGRAEHAAPDAHGDAGPRVPGEHWTPRHDGAALELPDHVRDLLGRRDEAGRPVFPPEGRDPLEHAMLLDRTHAVFRDEVPPDRLTNDHVRYTEALNDAAHRLYETAHDYSFRETDLRGLRRLADTVGATPDGALPHADLLHEVAQQTLGRDPAPRDVEALTRLAEHLHDQMGGRRPFELPSDALHRAAADHLGAAPGAETTRRAVERLAEERSYAPDPGGEHPVPPVDDYVRKKRERIDAANAAMREYEQKHGRLSPQDKHELRQRINEHLSAQERDDEPRRPKYRQETRRLIIGQAKRDKDGNILDANSGKPIQKGDLHIGHTPKNEWRKIRADAKRLDLTTQQINTVVQNPSIYQTEKGSGKDGNSSHRHEDKTKSPSELLQNAKKLPDGSVVVNGVRVYPDGRTVDAQTKKPIKQRELPTAWKMPTPAELKRAEREETKQAGQRQDWLEEVQDKSNLTRKEKDALEQVKKANALRDKANGSFVFKSSREDAEKKAAAAEQAAKEKIDNARKKWWQ
ncbi:GH-E family nuclease [Actinoallomurus bryophytorum]